jgi:hypothetical protein
LNVAGSDIWYVASKDVVWGVYMTVICVAALGVGIFIIRRRFASNAASESKGLFEQAAIQEETGKGALISCICCTGGLALGIAWLWVISHSG